MLLYTILYTRSPKNQIPSWSPSRPLRPSAYPSVGASPPQTGIDVSISYSSLLYTYQDFTSYLFSPHISISFSAKGPAPVHWYVRGYKPGFPVIEVSQPVFYLQAALGGILAFPHFFHKDPIHILQPLLSFIVSLIIPLYRIRIAPCKL